MGTSETELFTDPPTNKLRPFTAPFLSVTSGEIGAVSASMVSTQRSSHLTNVELKSQPSRSQIADARRSSTPGAAPSFLWFAAVQGIESKQDLTNLAPKRCFVAAEAIECKVGQIGKTQKSNVRAQ